MFQHYDMYIPVDIVSFVPIRSIGYKHSVAITPLPAQHKYPEGISWNFIKKENISTNYRSCNGFLLLSF